MSTVPFSACTFLISIEPGLTLPDWHQNVDGLLIDISLQAVTLSSLWMRAFSHDQMSCLGHMLHGTVYIALIPVQEEPTP